MLLRMLVVLAVLASTGGSAVAESVTPSGVGAVSTPCLSNVSGSPFEAASRFLDALEIRDEARLRQLTVSRAEFEAAIWPWLPVSRPEMNVTVDFAWSQYAMRNEGAFRRLLQNHVSEGYELVDLTLPKSPIDYAGFRLFEKPSVVVRAPSGETRSVRLFGSIVEMNGFYKIYGFKND